MRKIYHNPRVKVEVRRDDLGWIVTPINQRLNKALVRHCKDMADCGCPSWDGHLYIQEDWNQSEFANEIGMTTAERRDVNMGWAVVKLMDVELFLNRVGYDACHVTW